MFNMYNVLSETSDKRAWNTLPNTILLARFYLPAGVHKLTIDFLGEYGDTLDSKDVEVYIKAGKKNFIAIKSSVI
jgi:hypothetical protein